MVRIKRIASDASPPSSKRGITSADNSSADSFSNRSSIGFSRSGLTRSSSRSFSRRATTAFRTSSNSATWIHKARRSRSLVSLMFGLFSADIETYPTSWLVLSLVPTLLTRRRSSPSQSRALSDFGSTRIPSRYTEIPLCARMDFLTWLFRKLKFSAISCVSSAAISHARISKEKGPQCAVLEEY